MLYDYIIANYEKDEPIFLAKLPGQLEESIRQEIKRLIDEGKILLVMKSARMKPLTRRRKYTLMADRLLCTSRQ